MCIIMEADNMYEISDELLTAYIEGSTTPEETMRVVEALKHDASLRETLSIIEQVEFEESAGEFVPMARMAAASEGNLCDIKCEKRILKDFADTDLDSLTLEAEENSWMKDEGMPLHNIGRLLEKNGMSVARKYDSDYEEIADHLSHRYKVIAVVDYGILTKGEEDGVFHAVVCLSVMEGLIRLYDPAIEKDKEYLAEDFKAAWKASRNYMVYASTEGLIYEPHPIDVDDVLLDDDLLELMEAIAENTHEVWAKERQKEGWTYGPERNDELKQNPDMVPYSDLPESEKEYDRKTAYTALRLAKKLGFKVSREK